MKVAKVIEPDPGATERYGPYFEIYRSLYEKSKDEMHELATLGSGEPV